MSYPSALSSRPSTGSLAPPKSRIRRREPSGVFTLFQAPQIQQFKEAFSLIDQDNDGIVSEADLKAIFTSLGVNPTRSTLQSLLDARPRDESSPGTVTHNTGSRVSMIASSLNASTSSSSPPSSPSKLGATKGVNFTSFLTMMGEHLLELDPEADLLEAFACFDENDVGKVKVDEMRKWLAEVGDRMDTHEIDRLFKGPYTDRQGYFNYRDWAKALRVNQDDDENDGETK